ncbi:hypothetical protein AVEN_268750-1 [Araneus ventricosus]|uniref:Uncharacterized protein n=1 Tax=Araneus ventricosus TaxID=182803 RepID=A0A4Y2HAZ0_ARAVE|nr:hypothetical protein AVEN_268750-1 [Araneus ventricosus]
MLNPFILQRYRTVSDIPLLDKTNLKTNLKRLLPTIKGAFKSLQFTIISLSKRFNSCLNKSCLNTAQGSLVRSQQAIWKTKSGSNEQSGKPRNWGPHLANYRL